MSTKTSIIAVAGLAFALAFGLRWLAVRSRQRADAARAEIAKKSADLSAAIRRDEERIGADDRGRLALPAALRTVRPAASSSAAAARQASGSPDVAALIEGNPALFALGVRAYRASLGPHFGPLYRALALAPAQIDAFENLMTEHEEGLLDLNATAAAQGLEPSDPAVLAIRQQQDDQLRAAQLALLGDAGYRQLQQLGRVQPVEDIVASVATTVALTSTPLGSAQAAELTNFLADASSSYRTGDQADPATIDWDVALPQAQGILTGPQYGALKAESLKLQIEKIQAQFRQQESAAQ